MVREGAQGLRRPAEHHRPGIVVPYSMPRARPHDHRPIVLFDGLCAFCDGLVGYLLRVDRRRRLLFASLQSEAGRALLDRHGVGADVDSVVLIRDGRALVRSDAALGIASELGAPWSLARILRVIPRPVRDWAYRVFARHRYRLFGKLDSCRLPGEGEASRVLERAEELEGIEGLGDPASRGAPH